jgi:hypothetical protein
MHVTPEALVIYRCALQLHPGLPHEEVLREDFPRACQELTARVEAVRLPDGASVSDATPGRRPRSSTPQARWGALKARAKPTAEVERYLELARAAASEAGTRCGVPTARPSADLLRRGR